MIHKDIIICDWGSYPKNKGIISSDEAMEFGCNFTFSGYYNNNKIFLPNADQVIFYNSNHINMIGISLGQSYTISKFGFFRSPFIQIGVQNDYGINKFYPRGAFTFQKNEF